MGICVDCEENEATVADLYCDDCINRMSESIAIEDEWKYTDDLDYSVTKGSVNLEDRVNRVHPQLSCNYCRPHMDENTSKSWKFNGRRADKKKIAKTRRQGRELKNNQHKEEQ